MKIRRATIDDAGTIHALNRDVQEIHARAMPHLFRPPADDTFPVATVAEILQDPMNHVFVAEVDGEPAGYVYAQVVHRPEGALRYALDMVYIHHLSVRRDRRRQGCGRALMQRVLALARELGIARVELDVWSFNGAARRFFAGQGFAVCNERMCKEG